METPSCPKFNFPQPLQNAHLGIEVDSLARNVRSCQDRSRPFERDLNSLTISETLLCSTLLSTANCGVVASSA